MHKIDNYRMFDEAWKTLSTLKFTQYEKQHLRKYFET